MNQALRQVECRVPDGPERRVPRPPVTTRWWPMPARLAQPGSRLRATSERASTSRPRFPPLQGRLHFKQLRLLPAEQLQYELQRRQLPHVGRRDQLAGSEPPQRSAAAAAQSPRPACCASATSPCRAPLTGAPPAPCLRRAVHAAAEGGQGAQLGGDGGSRGAGPL